MMTEQQTEQPDLVIDVPATPGFKKLESRSLEIQSLYQNYLPATASEYVNGAEHLKDVSEYIKGVIADRFEITRPMDEAKKQVMAKYDRVLNRAYAARDNLKKGSLEYKTEQDRIAEERARQEREKAEREAKRLREEARIADEAAAKKERDRLAELQRKADVKAAAERKRLEEEQRIADEKAKAERERLAELERQAKADAAKLRAVEEEKRRAKEREEAEQRRIQEEKVAAEKRAEEEQERLHQEKLASEAAEREKTARAETLETRADDKMAAPVASAAPKVRGVVTKKVWKFEIVDKTKVPDQYKTIDEKKIRGVVNALKEGTDIPGVRVYWENAMAAGRGRD